MTEDFYDLLDVSPDASEEKIKQAYREQVRVYHPDLNDDDRAQAQFTAVRTAYDVLGDPVERRAYDRLGHEDYVAKRTSGLPSPDVWTSSSDDEDGRATATASAGRSGGGSETTVGSGSTVGATASTDRTGSAGGTTVGGTASSARTDTAGSSRSSTARSDGFGASNPRDATSRSGGGSGTTASAGTDVGSTSGSSGTRVGRFADTALVRWWRSTNFGWPLIWLSVAIYVVGLGQFSLHYEAGLRAVGAELAAAGADLEALGAVLADGRYGIATAADFVGTVEPIAPPLPDAQWYGALAGLVACSLLGILLARAIRREDTWGQVTIDETIVVAAALGVSTTLLGGPLLAGAVLMPLLFGVIVRRTRQLPGWKPTYLYALAVTAPAVGLAASALGYASLLLEVLAFVVVPLAGALGLPIRHQLRRRFG